jgi:hypothetical protein
MARPFSDFFIVAASRPAKSPHEKISESSSGHIKPHGRRRVKLVIAVIINGTGRAQINIDEYNANLNCFVLLLLA